MKTKFRRRYLIHPSSQFKYIAFSIVPALLMSLYCTWLLVESGNMALRSGMEKSLEQIYTTEKTIEKIRKAHSLKDSLNHTEQLEAKIASLKEKLAKNYSYTITSWNKTRRTIYIILFSSLFLVGVLALLNSHRIAGPLFRIKRCVDTFVEGKDTGAITLRKHDEFKELAASLEKLRMVLKEKGVLGEDNE